MLAHPVAQISLVAQPHQTAANDFYFDFKATLKDLLPKVEQSIKEKIAKTDSASTSSFLRGMLLHVKSDLADLTQ